MATKTNGTNGTASKSAHKEGVVIDSGYIVITMKLATKPTASKSGKTDTLASTGGFDWHDDLDYMGYDAIGVSVNVNGKK